MNPKVLVTLKRGIHVRLLRYSPTRVMGGDTTEEFNVTLTHFIGRCTGSQRDEKGKETRVIFNVSEVAWDKDNPHFYKLGKEYGLTGTDENAPHLAEVTLAADVIAGMQKLEK